MFSHLKYILTFCLLLLICILSAYLCFDKAFIHLWLNTYHNAGLDVFFRCYTQIAEWVVYIVAALLIFHKAGWSGFLLSATALSGGLAQIAKYIFDTDRPYKWFADHYPEVQLQFVDGVHLSKFYSFPSGHTTTFAVLFLTLVLVWATYNHKRENMKTRHILISLLCFVGLLLGGYSRIYLNQHFLEDIAGGLLIGTLSVLCLLPLAERWKDTQWWNFSAYRWLRSLRGTAVTIALLTASVAYSQPAQEPQANITIQIQDKEQWTKSELSGYVGKTVQMADDWYLCSNYNNYYISPRRIYSPTNQAIPLSAEYNRLLSLNSQGSVQLSGVNDYHRTGERLHNLVVKVNSTSSVTFVSGEWVGNSRADILKGYNKEAIDNRAEHTLLICGANLEYYLVDNLGTGYGPDNETEHRRQRNKVSKALSLINADIYGLMEIEQGQSAISEIASDLTSLTGRPFSYINDGGSSYGSYTKSGFVYCTQTVQPYSVLRSNSTGVRNRKYMQCFEHKQSGERFILSVNHFKAKSGAGTGANADQGDGQGSFNADRVTEAQSVLSEYKYISSFVQDADILIIGDLNAYAKEDPIRVLTDGGMTDLHRYFHADTSYSYVYSSEAGYLDHALCNSTLLPQVTGMLAYHINSDENDRYTYDKQDDGTMFRYSDHDPVLVGLRLGESSSSTPTQADLYYETDAVTLSPQAVIRNAAGGWVRIYTINGGCVLSERIPTDVYSLPSAVLPSGWYVVHIYHNGEVLQRKFIN